VKTFSGNLNYKFKEIIGSSREKLKGFNTATQSTPVMKRAIKKGQASQTIHG